MGSAGSRHFHVSLILQGKSHETVTVINPNFRRERLSRSGDRVELASIEKDEINVPLTLSVFVGTKVRDFGRL